MNEQRIDQIYQQLGMLEGRASSRTSARVGVRTNPRVGYGRNDMWPTTFSQHQNQQPEAVERTGILQQFLWGTGSPVIDTMNKMGWTDIKRAAPVNIRETIANMAGSLLGWSFVLTLPGIGKGISAGGAALAGGLKAAGVGAKLAGSMGKSMTVAGAMGAHRAWTQDKPLGKEVLTSMAFGATLAAGFHGLGVVARKTGMMAPTAEDIIKGNKGILSSTDEESMLAAFGKLPQKQAGAAVNKMLEKIEYAQKTLPSKASPFDLGLNNYEFMKLSPYKQADELVKLFKNAPQADTLFEPLFSATKGISTMSKLMSSRGSSKAGEIKSIIKAGKPMKVELTDVQMQSLSAGQKKILAGIQESKKLGEQYDGFTHLQRNVKSLMARTLKKYKSEDVVDLSRNAPAGVTELYVQRNALVQDLTWKFGNQIDDMLNFKVPLPHLKTVEHTAQDEAVLKNLKQSLNKGYNVLDEKNLWTHPKVEDFFMRWNAKTNKSFTNTTLMPKDMAKEYTELLKTLKANGESPYTIFYGMSNFPVPAEVLKKDIPQWIEGMTELPKGIMNLPTNLHDAYLLKRDITPVLGRFLTPIRHALGEPFTNDARTRVMMHQKTVDHYKGELGKIFKESGLKKKDLTEYGVRLGKALEVRDAPGKGTFIARVSSFLQPKAVGEKIVLNELPTDPAAIKAMAKEAGLTVKQMQSVHAGVKDAMKYIMDALPADKRTLLTGATKVEEIGSYHYVNELLKNFSKMKEPGKKELAQMLGLKDSKELGHLVKIKSMFNQMFKDSDIDPDRFIVSYMPHFRQFENVDYKMFLKELKKIGIQDKKMISSYQWVNEMARESGSLGYEENIFAAFSRYVSGYSKKKHFEDLFQTWNKAFKEMKLPKERLGLYRDLQEYMIGKPSAAEQQMDAMIYRFTDSVQKMGWKPEWGQRPTQELSSLLAELQYAGGLGFNPFTAVKNLTQKGLAFSSITDDGNPFHGMAWFFKARAFRKTPEGKMIQSLNPIAHNRQFFEGLKNQEDAISKFLERIGLPSIFTKTAKTVTRKSFDMFKASDISNVQDTFMAKYLYLVQSKGASISDAINMATGTTMATQFMYGFDSPMLYKGPFGKQLGIFMSWPLNWAQLLYTQGTEGQVRQAIGTVGTMAIMSQMLNLTGMNFNSIHPVNTARGFLPIAMLQGEERFPMAFRSAAALTTAIKELARGDEVAIDASFDELKRRMVPLVPLGVVGKRTLDFIDLAKNDWKRYDKRGRLQSEASVGEGLRSLFGPTMEAYERSQAYQQIQRQQGSYRRMRSMAILSFMEEDYNNFEKLQEQLVVNFGKWITPQDIQQEMKLRDMTSRQRQLMSMPESFSDPWLEQWGS